MSHNRKLVTDSEFQEAMERKFTIRVFHHDHVVDSGCVIIRFDDSTIVLQSGVSELSYRSRDDCEFFGMKRG
ncbi:hypothetical protein [Paenibacillus sp. YYML68]|uniref:hypothetical protein n=1 Tax=Paenibacillus sp. YYML68 TaxID=2909250 RepID=UPI0024923297|nr:hypothetical protein [Paenibacillus sp. YYML68]